MELKNNENKVRVQFNIIGLLGLVFIVLKLTGYIDWSWWWVLAPFWIGWGIILVVLGILMIVALVWGVGATVYTSVSTQKRK